MSNLSNVTTEKLELANVRHQMEITAIKEEKAELTAKRDAALSKNTAADVSAIDRAIQQKQDDIAAVKAEKKLIAEELDRRSLQELILSDDAQTISPAGIESAEAVKGMA